MGNLIKKGKMMKVRMIGFKVVFGIKNLLFFRIKMMSRSRGIDRDTVYIMKAVEALIRSGWLPQNIIISKMGMSLSSNIK
jgi:hypothetical protein